MSLLRGMQLVFCVLALACAQATLAAPADDIKALIDKGDSKSAYELGKKYPDQLGEPAFDFYFGVAAIDSGHAGEGVLALERYMINFPDNHNARLELARGYFVMGDNQRARDEFDNVLKTNPPPAVVANIERFMDALRAREGAYRTTGGVFIEGGFGYDSNVNGGVSGSNINLPVFGNVIVSPLGVSTHSTFGWVAAGGDVSFPIAPGLSVFANGQIDSKLNTETDAKTFDQGNIAVSGGLAYFKDKNFYRLTGGHSEVSVDYKRFRNVDSLSGEWLHQLDELQTISPFVQVSSLTYTGANQLRDSELYATGLGYRRAFIGKWQPLLTISGNVSKEHNTEGRPDLGRDMYGGRIALAVTPAPKWALSVGATYQNSQYSGPDVLLATTRKDDYYAFDAIASYAYTRNFSIRGELLISNNDSNLELYRYRRDILAVKVRYDFR